MKRDLDTATPSAAPHEHIELMLAAVEAGAAFRSSPRHRALLRFMVEHMIAGDLASLKETVIAIAPPGPDEKTGGRQTGISLQTDDVDVFHETAREIEALIHALAPRLTAG